MINEQNKHTDNRFIYIHIKNLNMTSDYPLLAFWRGHAKHVILLVSMSMRTEQKHSFNDRREHTFVYAQPLLSVVHKSARFLDRP